MEIIAHRGASADAPENTLAAFRLAWEQGADAIECDVHLTKDGQLAVIHDDDTQRTTGAKGQVHVLTSEALQRMDAGRWKHARWAGETIPLLPAVLASVPVGKRIFVEVKGGLQVLEPLIRDVVAAPLGPGQTVLISFEFELIEALRRRVPDRAAGWIVNHPWKAPGFQEIVQRARSAALSNVCFCVKWSLTPERVHALHEAGLAVYVWTVDDCQIGEQLAMAGVDGLISNVPGRLAEICRKSQQC